MAKPRKSRPKHKAADRLRATTPHAATKPRPTPKPRASRQARAAPDLVKSPAADPLDEFIDAAARVLVLRLEPSWRPAVKANLEVTLRFAALVAELALPDEAEPAPIFMA